MPDKKGASNEDAILNSLLEKKMLSSAQVEVAKIDISATGLTAIDVLLTRKWISDEQATELQNTFGSRAATQNASTVTQGRPSEKSNLPDGSRTNAAPRGKPSSSDETHSAEDSRPYARAKASAEDTSTSEQTYLENLKVYRKLMADIMGESG
ncbi:MAG TPA: hypothetical protein V6C97_33355 [Oculatellaceae cyanobacterium]